MRNQYQYKPGVLSHLYQNLSVVERPAIDREVDRLFVKETGITAKLDWSRERDKPQARLWLCIRDVVIAKHFLGKAQELGKKYNAASEEQARILASQFQAGLKTEVEQGGLPELHEDPLWGLIIEIGHLATEAFDIAELADLWPLVLGHHAAHTATLYVTGILAPFVNLLGGLYSMGHANEAGQRGAERNAFKWGFASTVAAMAERGDWHPTLSSNTPWGHQQGRGRNAAIRLLKQMGPEVGWKFLERYRGRGGKAKVLEDVGGYD